MEELKEQIEQKLKQMEEMIIKGEGKKNIEVKRKELDKLLERYLKDLN